MKPKALVTGAAGFVGRHMAAELWSRDWWVHECDIADAAPIPGEDALDIFESSDYAVDLVVHCAAAEPHRAAIDGDRMNLVRNLHLDSAMFDWAVRTGTRVLYLSSSAVYPTSFQDPKLWGPRRMAEAFQLGTDPDAAYGWTKLTGEKMAAAAGEHIPVHIVRPFSGYGEDQDERWPFGAFVGRARRREDPFVIWGDGTQVRDWIHIDDVVAGALAVVEQDVREPVNLCTGLGTSMLELVELMCAEVGYSPRIELLADKPTGVGYRVGDPTRMHAVYEPRVSLAEGVKRALA